MQSNPLVETVLRIMEEVEMKGAELVQERYDSESFGNAEALFRLGPLLLRFSRDRSVDVLEVASTEARDLFHYSGDIEVAMGWKSEADVRMNEAEPLAEALQLLVDHLDEF